MQDRVHHAFLFCGPRGCGKTTTARILAKALNCEKGPTPEPCGTCDACTSITNGNAVDYFEMDGASNRGIDSIRDLTEAVRYQPAAFRKKVYVIDEVHMLTTEAFNALLKTLEEPPPHVTFIMATTEPHKVPNTILSRCQRFDFKLVPSGKLISHMGEILNKEEIPIDEGSLHLIARESGGSVRDALSLCDQLISYVGTEGIEETKVAEVLGVADRSLVRTLISSLASGDAKTCLGAVDGAIARGVDEVQIARALVRSLRDLAVAQVAPDAQELLEGSAEERKDIAEQAASLEPSRVRQMFDRMLQACNELGETEQPRLVLDMGLIDVAATEAALPVGDLIARLKAMEARLVAAGSSRSPRGSTDAVGTAEHNSTASRIAVKTATYDESPPTSSGAETTPGPVSTPVSATSEVSAPASSPISISTPAPAPAVSTPAPAVSTPAPTAPAPAPAVSTPAPTATAPAPAVSASTPAPAVSASTPGPAVSASTPAPAEPVSAPPAPAVSAPPAPAVSALSEPVSAPAAIEPQTPAPSEPPPPAAPTAPPLATHALRSWESVMNGLDAAKEYGLMTVYQTAKVLQWKDGLVSVGFPEGALTTEIALEKEKVKRMQVFLNEHTGESLQFKVSILTGDEEVEAVSVLEDAKKREAEDRVARLEEAKNHPMTKLVLRTFGAVIKEIKIDDV